MLKITLQQIAGIKKHRNNLSPVIGLFVKVLTTSLVEVINTLE
jgi:hypothetical protein